MHTLPKIPGMMSDYHLRAGKTNFHRKQVLNRLAQGWNVDNNQNSHQSNHPPTSFRPETAPPAVPLKKVQYVKKVPDWIAKDRQVLRFYGYFEEKVQEKGISVLRIRRVTLMLYLVDSSVYIYEPKILNSGLEQGTFMRRSRVLKKNGDKYEPLDFQVGGIVKFSGRDFHLVSADKSTRQFYQNVHDVALQEDGQYPDEVERVKETVKVTKKVTNGTKQFLENDRKVLRFYCSWLDPHPLYPEKRDYVLHYYLSDDTVEVREVKDPNAGRGGSSLLVSRGKLKKIPSKSGRNYKPLDFKTGEQIVVYNRIFDILDCDAFTRDYYVNTHGITQELIPATPKVVVQHPVVFAEDSGVFRRMLAPKPTSKNQKEALKLDRKVLRFRGKFDTPISKVDGERNFVVTFYLVDDSLAIYEPPVRNSGIVGGKFLDRGHFVKADATSKRFFTASDFFTDAVVTLEFAPHQKLRLVEGDAHTLEYCEEHPELFAYSDMDAIAHVLSVECFKQKMNVRRRFQNNDVKDIGSLVRERFDGVLTSMGLKKLLNKQQLITLYRHLSIGETKEGKKGDKQLIDYNELCDLIARAHARQTMTKTTISDDPSGPIAQVLHRVVQTQGVSFRTLFAGLANARESGRISRNEFLKMMDFYRVPISHVQAQSLFDIFEVDGTNEVDYTPLSDAIYQCDFSGNCVDQPQKVPRASSPTYSTHSMDLSGFDIPEGPTTRPPTAPQLSLPTVSEHIQHLKIGNQKVISILTTKYGAVKYKLRALFRKKDTSGNGRLGTLKILNNQKRKTIKTLIIDEDDFMDALLSINDDLTDDETYAVADAYFPTSSCTVDYKAFMDSAFKVTTSV